jgi:hypothetical protein
MVHAVEMDVLISLLFAMAASMASVTSVASMASVASVASVALSIELSVSACVCPTYISPVCTADKLYINECFARCQNEMHSWMPCQDRTSAGVRQVQRAYHPPCYVAPKLKSKEAGKNNADSK